MTNNIELTFRNHSGGEDRTDVMSEDEARELLQHPSYERVSSSMVTVADGIPAQTATHYENIFARIV